MGQWQGPGTNGKPRKKKPVSRARRAMSTVAYVLLLVVCASAGAFIGWKVRNHALKLPAALNNALPASLQSAPEQPESPPPPPVLLLKGIAAIPIIMYHDVTLSKDVWFDMTTREFTRQMDDLAEAGAHPIRIQELYDHLLSGVPLPAHPILLTFDDCTLGQFTDALPVLIKHHFPAVFFVQTGLVGRVTGKEHMTWA